MARIWMEGFEDGLPQGQYLEGTPNSQFFKDATLASGYPTTIFKTTGRSGGSSKSIKIARNSGGSIYIPVGINKTIPSSTELYGRVHFKISILESTQSYTAREVYSFLDSVGNKIAYVYQSYNSTNPTFKFYVRINGVDTLVHTFTMTHLVWHKLEVHIKTNATTGLYELKVNNVSLVAATGVNTGSNGITNIFMGDSCQGPYTSCEVWVDDIALNDTSGSINNSWCGDGTIVSLKPKAVGNKSQWDLSQGWALAETSSTTTTINITNHGLATDDVMYNATRDAYRIITKTSDNQFTVATITGQVAGDRIILFKYASTITAGTGTSSGKLVLAGHTLQSYDATVNTSRTNAIRRAIFIDGASVYVSWSANPDYGGLVTNGQLAGDSIKTFNVLPYPISNHYKAVIASDPNPQYSHIQSSTSGDIDTFDMEELTADKLLPSNTTIVAASINIYAQEAGAGSQIKPVFRISGVDYEGSTIDLSAGTLEYQAIYDASPATSSAFLRADVDALEVGVKLV